mmetsp:Transcript_3378/g.8352  ORF Transcript_3378/g.8352 Transcript_3378/m.8352 type:complete len:113 (+) Transcript_3378:3238-3576(+)
MDFTRARPWESPIVLHYVAFLLAFFFNFAGVPLEVTLVFLGVTVLSPLLDFFVDFWLLILLRLADAATGSPEEELLSFFNFAFPLFAAALLDSTPAFSTRRRLPALAAAVTS